VTLDLPIGTKFPWLWQSSMETLGNMSVGSYCKYKQWLLIEARWSIFIVLFTLFRNVRQIWWFERLCVFTGARKIGAVMVFLFNGKCITNLKPGECSTFTVFLHNTNSFRKVKSDKPTASTSKVGVTTSTRWAAGFTEKVCVLGRTNETSC